MPEVQVSHSDRHSDMIELIVRRQFGKGVRKCCLA